MLLPLKTKLKFSHVIQPKITTETHPASSIQFLTTMCAQPAEIYHFPSFTNSKRARKIAAGQHNVKQNASIRADQHVLCNAHFD